MSNRSWIGVGVLVLIVIGTAVQLAGALGRISVLMEQADSAEVVTATALEGEAQAVTAMNVAFDQAVGEMAAASVAIAEVRAELIVQEGVAETSFRRAEALAADNPVLEQAIQEMRGDAIVASMKADSVIATQASVILTAQNRIATLERLDTEGTAARALTTAAFRAEISLKDQIIAEQQRALAPSFLTKLFAMPEVAMFGAAVGAAATLLLVP